MEEYKGKIVSSVLLCKVSHDTHQVHVCSLGRFNDGTNEEHKEEVISWENKDIWV
jgi:hypothetical protein